MNGLFVKTLQRTRDFGIGARRYDRHALFEDSTCNAQDLRFRFSLTQYRFRHSLPQHTMVIHVGVPQWFKREIAQTIKGLINREIARLQLLKEGSKC